MDIEILEIRFPIKDTPLRAFVDVKFNGMTIRDFRVIKESDKRYWVASPQISWKDSAAGQLRYKTIITFSDELKGELDRHILNAYHEEKGEDADESTK